MTPQDGIRTQRLTKQAIAGFTLAALAIAGGLIATPATAGRSSSPAPASAGSMVQAVPDPVRILAPMKHALVTGGTLAVRVELQRGDTRFSAWLDGTSITRRFRKDRQRFRVARIPTAGVAPGRHYIRVGTTNRGERRFHQVAFVMGRRTVDFVHRVRVLKSTVPAAGAGTIPLALGLTNRGLAAAADRRAHRPILQIRVNGRVVSSRLPAGGGRLTTVLSADEGLHHGRNVVTILAYRKDGRYDAEKRVVNVPRNVPLAAANRARATVEGRSVQLSGKASVASARGVRLRYQWRIVKRPERSTARLLAATRATPSLIPDRHGSYVVALTVSERRGGRVKRSTDLTTVFARPNFPPMGVPLDTMATKNGARGIQVGNDFYATQSDAGKAHVLVLDRLSLQKQADAALPADGTIDSALSNILSPYVRDLADHLVVLTGPAGCCKESKTLPVQAFSYVFPLKAGVADIGHLGMSNVGLNLEPDNDPVGDLAGFLQYQGSEPYSFVQTDNLAFNTRSSLTTRIPAPQTVVKGGRMYLLSSKLGTALDIADASTSNGKPTVANRKTGQLSQQWVLSNDYPYAPHFLVININSGLCLDVTNGSKAENAAIAQWPCDYLTAGGNQLWDPVRRSDGAFALKNVGSGMVLTVKDDSATAGTLIVQASDKGADGQRWQLEEQLGKLQNGVMSVVSQLGTALTVPATGNQLVMQTETGALTQQWLAVGDPHERAWFQFRNIANGLCVDVLGSSTAKGASVVQQPCDGSFATKSQLWQFSSIGPRLHALLNVNSGLALSVQGDSKASGASVVQASNDWTEGQSWYYRQQPPAPRAHEVYVIASKLGTVLDPADGSTDKGQPVAARERTDLPSQRWRLFPDPEAPGKFQVMDNASGLCLDVTGASTAPNAQVAQWPCDSGHEQSNQLWTPVRQPDGSYKLANVHSGLALTVQGNSKSPGTAVVQDSDTGADGQRWLFEAIAAAPRDAGVFVVASTLGPAIDRSSGSTAHDKPAVGAAETDQASQQWLFYPAGDEGQKGSFALVNLTSGLCLEAPGATAGAQVSEDDCVPNYDNDRQLWTPVAREDGSGYALKNRASGLVLSLQGGSTAPQVPVVQSEDAGTDAQTWLLRPLSRFLTATVGERDYTVPVPLSWGGFAVLGIDAAGRPIADPSLFFAYANTGNGDLDRREQTDLAAELSAWAKTPGTTVLLQSAGSPHPTSRSWGDIGNAVARLGGNAQVFDQLDGSGDYAFVGCAGCSGMPDASFPLTRAPDADNLSGVLTRGSSSTFEPSVAMSLGTASPSLLALAYQEPTPWRIPANDAQRAALKWIAEHTGLTGAACYAPPVPDVRSTYCNMGISFGDKHTDLQALQPPSDPSALGFTYGEFAVAFAVVKTELLQEFEWVSDVRNLIANLQKPFGTDAAGATVDFVAISRVIQESLTMDGRTSEVNGLSVTATILEAVGVFFAELPPVEIAFTLVASSLELVEELSEEPDGSWSLGDFPARADQLGSELHDRFKTASETLDFVGSLLVTDQAKLRTAALADEGQDPSRNWQICDQQNCGISLKDLDRGLTIGARQWLWTHMLPAAFDDVFAFSPPAGKSVRDIMCFVNPNSIPIQYSRPFGDAPDSALYDGIVTGFDSAGTPQTGQTRVLARADRDFSVEGVQVRVPSSNVTDSLFRPLKQGGVGLHKTTLFTDPAFSFHDWTPRLPHGDKEIGENRCDWQKPR
jgi:Ricin-type beta-trefoil lectin domain-like